MKGREAIDVAGAGTRWGRGNSMMSEPAEIRIAEISSPRPTPSWVKRCSKGCQEVAKSMRRARTKSRHRNSHSPFALAECPASLPCAGVSGHSSESDRAGPSSQGSPLPMAWLPQHPLRAELREMPGGSDGVMMGRE